MLLFLLVLIIGFFLLQTGINHLLGDLHRCLNGVLSIHFTLHSEDEPHEQVVHLVANQLQLIDQKVVFLREDSLLQARAILEHSSAGLEVRDFYVDEPLN
jgi:hypothetical protein